MCHELSKGQVTFVGFCHLKIKFGTRRSENMKRGIKTIIALSLVGCMTIGMGVMAYAKTYTESKGVGTQTEEVKAVGDDVEVTVTGDVNVAADPETPSFDPAVEALDNASVTVTGDVNTDLNYAVSASSSTPDNPLGSGTIEIKGSVTNTANDGYGVKSSCDSLVTVGKNVTASGEAVVVNSGGEVKVTGDVTGGTDGIHSDEGGTVSVVGNVKGNIAVTDATVSVGKNLTGTEKGSNGSFAISETGDSSIVIDGDVTSQGSGILTDGDSTIIIMGSLTALSSDPVIVLDHSKTEDWTNYSENKSAGVSTIVVHEIKGDLKEDSNLVKSGYKSGKYDWTTEPMTEPKWVDDAASGKEQIKNIFYIIKKAEGSEDKFTGSIGNAKKFNDGKIEAAPENTVITVTVKEGYGVKAGTIEVTKNADGSYSLTVPRGGGVTLTAEALKEAVDDIIEEEKKEEEKKEQEQKQEQQQQQQQEQQKEENKKDEKKSDDSSSDSSSNNTANSAPAVSPFVAYAPVLTIGGGQAVTFSGLTLGADTGIKMEEPGPIAEAAFATAMPEGFTKGFTFSITNGGQTTYAVKNGKISFKIPAQFLLAGRQFKLMGIDKDGNVKVFDNKAAEDGSFEADVDVEGYQFELIYKD